MLSRDADRCVKALLRYCTLGEAQAQRNLKLCLQLCQRALRDRQVFEVFFARLTRIAFGNI